MFVSTSEGEKKKKTHECRRLMSRFLRRLITGEPGATMCPELLLFLLLAALNAESTAAAPENSTGLNFIVAFPENIAYYHPDQPLNTIKVTALYDGTNVIIKQLANQIHQVSLNAGETKKYTPGGGLELARAEKIQDKTLQIISNKVITVHVVNLKNNSVQSSLVIPTDNLGTEYLIPPTPKIRGTTDPSDEVTLAVTERGPFKLIIINTDQVNQATVKGEVSKEFELQPHEIAQVWVTEVNALRVVKAEQPVAVLFGHACAIRHNCTCGQLYTMLPPAKEEKLKFYIPPSLVTGAEAETFILVSEKDQSTRADAFDPNSPLVETAGTAILYRPGLLLSLIPEKDFAACSVINSIPDVENHAVIMVHKDFTDGVHIGSLPLDSPEWENVKGTEYVSTSVVLSPDKNVIWHSSSKMAVYYLGNMKGTLFGNPAPIISQTPDKRQASSTECFTNFRGCVLSPEVVQIGEVAGGWRESLKYCRDNNLELVSLSEAQLQKQVYEKIIQAKDESLQDVWIGMRRSSQTGEWYWLSKEPVNDTNWAEGEPGTVHDGQCAMMSLEKNKAFGWSDEDCCKDAHPICYSSPVLLPM